MMTREIYIRRSLDSGIFWLRVIKDFVTVTAGGLNLSGHKYIQPLERFRFHCEMLLAECLDVGSGLVSDNLRQCRALITEFTEECEARTQQLSGFVLNTRLNKVHSALNDKPVAVRAGKLPDVYKAVKLINGKAAELATSISAMINEIATLQLEGKLFSHCMPSAHMLFLKSATQYSAEIAAIEADAEIQMSLSEKAAWVKDSLIAVQCFLDPGQAAEFAVAQNLVHKLNNYGEEVAAEGFLPLANTCEKYIVTLTDNLLNGKIMSTLLPLLPDSLLRIVRRTSSQCEYY